MYRAYIDWKPHKATRDLLDKIIEVIDEWQELGYVLTVRQIYYQFVKQDLIKNDEKMYRKFITTIRDARMAGEISWKAIEDRARSFNDFYFREDATELVSELPDIIQFDYWDRQEYYVEVWVEKDALGNVIEKACTPWRVPHLACRGYVSASEAWRAGRRFLDKAVNHGKQGILLHLADHDPCGIDMTRDNRDRLAIFSEVAGRCEVKRIALNMDQVEELGIPPNPAKQKDARFAGYEAEFGESSWELDGLPPTDMEELIVSHIKEYIDMDIWKEVVQEELEVRQYLHKLVDRWDDVEDFLNNE